MSTHPLPAAPAPMTAMRRSENRCRGQHEKTFRMNVNPQAQADAIIIIFGAAVRPDGTPSPTLCHRVAAAARFGARFAHPLFIPTGAKGRYGDAEATVMARHLIAAGFPETA